MKTKRQGREKERGERKREERERKREEREGKLAKREKDDNTYHNKLIQFLQLLITF